MQLKLVHKRVYVNAKGSIGGPEMFVGGFEGLWVVIGGFG